ncbi:MULTISPECIES: DUF945 family protein [unclassified Thioalkalivibrio]|uniref:DUF945 family protein n=1 Tax=unclassified Thioalkalivibrio TaxID=2621013 RepID=UPI0003631829|nr:MULTISPECIES: DUF945 family protein [unclassified Thioalkalivibrio]
MRKWIILAALLVAIGAAWPWYVGGQVEDTLDARMELQADGLELRHEPVRYERGYREARAEGTLHLRRGEDAYELPVVHEVQHGVLGARIATRLDHAALDDALAEHDGLAAILQRLAPEAESRTGLGGGVTTRLRVQDTRLDVAQWAAVAPLRDAEGPLWLEFEDALGQFAWSDEQAMASLSVPRLRLDQADGTLVFEGLRQVLALEPDADGVYGVLPDYEGGVAADRMEWTGPGCEGSLLMERARINAFQSTHGDRLDARARLEIDRMTVTRGTQRLVRHGGPMDLQLGLERWDRAAMEQLAGTLRDPAHRRQEAEQRRDLTHAAMIDAVSQSLERSPAVTLGAIMNDEPEQRLELEGNLVFSGTPEGFRMRPVEAIALDMQAAVGLQWPESLAGLTDPQPFGRVLAAAEADAWLERDGEILSGTLAMRDGRIHVNERDRTASALGLLFAAAGGMF